MRKGIVALLAVLCLLLGGLYSWMRKQDDVTPPEIRFPEGAVLYEEGTDSSFLLEGVQAIDDLDGDVSDTLVIESIIPMQDSTSATVLYYAKDKSNNIAKATRIVEYMPEEGIPWIVETEEETVAEIRKETESEKKPKEDPLPPGSPRITLTTNRVTIKQGESYDLLSYVKDIKDDVDGDDWLYRQIHIGGMYEIDGPGTYELIYTVIDRDGNMSNEAKLILTIE